MFVSWLCSPKIDPIELWRSCWKIAELFWLSGKQLVFVSWLFSRKVDPAELRRSCWKVFRMWSSEKHYPMLKRNCVESLAITLETCDKPVKTWSRKNLGQKCDANTWQKCWKGDYCMTVTLSTCDYHLRIRNKFLTAMLERCDEQLRKTWHSWQQLTSCWKNITKMRWSCWGIVSQVFEDHYNNKRKTGWQL